jgi:response regulator of citrate/malate metabolism
VQTLASPFSAYSDLSYLSYAESYSIVDYLIRTFGKDKMFQLLDTFRQGSTYDGALQKVYGFDTAGLNTTWQKSLGISQITIPVK